jgi:hypothetical protein
VTFPAVSAARSTWDLPSCVRVRLVRCPRRAPFNSLNAAVVVRERRRCALAHEFTSRCGGNHLEDAAVIPVLQRRGRDLAARRHVPDRLPHDLHDPGERALTGGSKPTQARELGAEADELVVLLRPRARGRCTCRSDRFGSRFHLLRLLGFDGFRSSSGGRNRQPREERVDGGHRLSHLVRRGLPSIACLHVDPRVARPRHLPDLVARAVLTRLTEGVRRDLAGICESNPCGVVPHLGQDLVHRTRPQRDGAIIDTTVPARPNAPRAPVRPDGTARLCTVHRSSGVARSRLPHRPLTNLSPRLRNRRSQVCSEGPSAKCPSATSAIAAATPKVAAGPTAVQSSPASTDAGRYSNAVTKP